MKESLKSTERKNKMPSLDEQVRQGLVEWETGIAVEIHLNPKFETTKGLKRILDKIEGSIKGENPEAKREIKFIRGKLKELDGMVEEGEQTFREYFSLCYFEQAANVKEHSEQLVGKYLEFVRMQRTYILLGKLFTDESGSEPKAKPITKADAEVTLHSYNLAVERFVHSVEETGKLVKAVTKVAHEKGIETALAEETIAQVTRAVFPTAEQYGAFLDECLQARVEFCEAEIAILDTIMSDEDGDDVNTERKKGWELAMKYMVPVNEEKVKRIYGAHNQA